MISDLNVNGIQLKRKQFCHREITHFTILQVIENTGCGMKVPAL